MQSQYSAMPLKQRLELSFCLPFKIKLFMRLILAILMFLFFIGCKKSSPAPECIQERISQLEHNGANLCPHGSVREYLFQGAPVFVFDLEKCIADGGAEVVDANCQRLGALGTIAGSMRINNVIFYDNARLIRTVWQR